MDLYNKASDIPREEWETWDPILISEAMFSAANLFSSLKLMYIFSVNAFVGPLLVSLSLMLLDIIKFFLLDAIILFAFSCGLNQLLWYYADMEKQRCPSSTPEPDAVYDLDACLIWRSFSDFFETSQTLFWAAFGQVDLDNFELAGIKSFTRSWGMLMFACYSIINVVLIAMINLSYQQVSERADIEWKFARSKLWISYFKMGGTVPPPFNVIPTPKSMWYFLLWLQRKICGHSHAAKREHMRNMQQKSMKANESDLEYQSITQNLVRRYITLKQRKGQNERITEDDVNEIKQDITTFRFELIEILTNSGMDTSTSTGPNTGTRGKKSRQKERRLMKEFDIASPAPHPNQQH